MNDPVSNDVTSAPTEPASPVAAAPAAAKPPAPPKRSHHKKPAAAAPAKPQAKAPAPAAPNAVKGGSTQTVEGTRDAVEQLQSLLTKLTPAERDRLAAAGVTVPQGDIASIIEGRYKWGLRCTHCGKLALYFVGDQFELHGELFDKPTALPHNRIAWTQALPADQIDRHDPRCQSCGDMIPLHPDGSFIYNRGNPESDRRVQLEHWNTSRDARYDRRAARATVRAAERATASLQPGDSRSFNLPDTPVSQIIDETHGEGTSARLDAAAEAHGIADAVRTGNPAAVGL